MDITAKQISEWAKQSIKSLSLRPDYGSLVSVYRELSRTSGLSESLIKQFYNGLKPNPTQDTIDALVTAIKKATVKKAA